MEYDDTSVCALNSNCSITINLEKDMKAPIFVFYELHNFYQNHRRYIRSKSSTQLAGTEITTSDAQSSCDPVYLMQHIGVTKSWGGYDLKPGDLMSPCGLIAKSLFNGIFTENQRFLNFYLKSCFFSKILIFIIFFIDTYSHITKDSDGVIFPINEKGIAWPNDVGKKFKRTSTSNKTQWTDPENGKFI